MRSRNDATESLRSLSRLEIDELRRMRSPPVPVRRCLEVVYLILNAEKHERKLLSRSYLRVEWEDVLQVDIAHAGRSHPREISA